MKLTWKFMSQTDQWESTVHESTREPHSHQHRRQETTARRRLGVVLPPLALLGPGVFRAPLRAASRRETHSDSLNFETIRGSFIFYVTAPRVHSNCCSVASKRFVSTLRYCIYITEGPAVLQHQNLIFATNKNIFYCQKYFKLSKIRTSCQFLSAGIKR